jgi:hypothetical protein
MTIVNDDSRVVNKLEASLTDDTRVIIYDRHRFIIQATGVITKSGVITNGVMKIVMAPTQKGRFASNQNSHFLPDH